MLPETIFNPTVLAVLAALALAIFSFFIARLFVFVGGEFGRYDLTRVGPVFSLMLPLSKRLGNLPEWIANNKALEEYKNWARGQLVRSGLDEIFTPEEYVGSHILLMILGMIVPVLFYLTFPFLPGNRIMGASVILGFIFLFMPFYYLNSIIQERKKEIFRSMPYFLDLMTLLVEANTEFTEAIKRTTKQLSKGPLATEMRRFLSQLQVGSSRPAALKELATRVDTPEMTSLVTALLHVSEQGREETLGQVMRTQAELMRFRRVQFAEQLANQAPVKMLLPMLLFIFPSVFLILLGPLLIQAKMGQSSM